MPRFEKATFLARFPFATIKLEEDDFPIVAEVKAWSPFIPGDADNSGLPAGAIEYTLENTSGVSMDGVFSFHSKNFMRPKETDSRSEKGGKDSIAAMNRGFILTHTPPESLPHFRGEFGIFTNEPTAIVDHCWFRGGWWDPLSITWQTIRDGATKNNPPVETGAPGASIYIPFVLDPGAKKTYRIMMTWYVPVTDQRFGNPEKEADKCVPGSGCCSTSGELGASIADSAYQSGNYKPWYSNRFKNITEASDYWMQHYDELLKKTTLFRETFYSMTLPPEVVEAIAANLTILKSPTVLRQFDGRIWSWEGCSDSSGCCHGSCTHVWNYAQAMAHLFPAMERTLRHSEFCESQSSSGHQTFRSALPIRRVDHDFHAAADGQLGGIMKVYREWRISGDNAWMKKCIRW